jgi:methyl acetate hydrolase
MKAAGALVAAPALARFLGGSASAEPLARGHGGMRGRSGAFAPIDQLLQRAVHDGTVAGVVALGATGGGVAYEGAFGRHGIAQGPAMSLDTVFWLGSLTKAVTATACMQLIERGKLHLDQPMGTLLPELASPKVLEGFDASGAPILRPAKRAVTLRHLLTHTSGYTYSIWSENLTRYQKVTGIPDISSCKNAAFSQPMEFDPGERWQYGIGLDWVGKAVEAVTDQSLEMYFRENIFAPLGMKDSGFLLTSDQRRRIAPAYRRKADGSLEPSLFEVSQRPEFFQGGGGMFSTPRDYIALLQMLLHDGTFRGARVLRPETVASMRQNHIGDLHVAPLKTAQPVYSHDCDLFPGMVQKWGLSFDINTEPGPAGRSAGSISWAGYLNCYYWIDPVKHVTGAIFTQVVPFYDPGVVRLYAGFERGLYDGLRQA